MAQIQVAADLSLEGNKLLKALLEQGNTAAMAAALTGLSQIGFDTTKASPVIYDGSAVRKILLENDISSEALGTAVTNSRLLVTPTSIKTYVDSLISSGQSPISDFNATTNTTFPSGATLANRYRVTVAGTLTGASNVILQVGDVIFPRTNTPSTTDANDWVVVQGNSDLATTTVLGLVMLATLTEVQNNTGGAANKALTVSVFNSYETANPRLKKYSATITSLTVGANTVTHNLGSTDVQAKFYVGSNSLILSYSPATNNTITINSNNAYSNVRVVVIS